MKIYKNIFEKIISVENLFSAWDNFKKGKRNRTDVLNFEWNLEENIFRLKRSLEKEEYKHDPYKSFYITDPKLRHIHKASVRDRIVHHAIYSVVNPLFEETFIPDSYSCRIGHGTHKGVDKLEEIVKKVSKNNTVQCYALKCDIQKFFNTIDHKILISILKRRIKDIRAVSLIEEIIGSYLSSYSNLFKRKGLPLGNLTSQLFANIYMNEFDQFVKQILKIKDYIRYTDDFVVISSDKLYLEDLIPKFSKFLEKNLELKIHPNKIEIRKLRQGIDFLGYVTFPKYRLLRSKTKRRIFLKIKNKINEYKLEKINKSTLEQSLQSYIGVLSHANTYKLTTNLKNQFWFWLNSR